MQTLSPDEERRFQSNALAELIFEVWFVADQIRAETGRFSSAEELASFQLLVKRLEQFLAEFRKPQHWNLNGHYLPELRQAVLKLRVALAPVAITPEMRDAAHGYVALFSTPRPIADVCRE